MPCELLYHFKLDESFCIVRGVWFILFLIYEIISCCHEANNEGHKYTPQSVAFDQGLHLDQLAKPTFRSRYAHTPFGTG